MNFERKLENALIAEFLQTDFWKNYLKEECENQQLFLAIRNNTIGIYHKGGRLFSYEKKEFKTHLKYASVIENPEKDYLTKKELSKVRLISDFKNNYLRIKENCSLYAGIEAIGVSEIYHNYSYLSDNNIVVLDIEISFGVAEKSTGSIQDRIDFLLYDIKNQTLKFVEAKHYSNKEIWSTKTPEVIGQIEKYEKQITQKRADIITAYENYIQAINTIFNKTLPLPLKVEDKVALLIFGFDDDQKKGRLQKLILNNAHYKGCQIYCKQDKINPASLWNSKVL